MTGHPWEQSRTSVARRRVGECFWCSALAVTVWCGYQAVGEDEREQTLVDVNEADEHEHARAVDLAVAPRQRPEADASMCLIQEMATWAGTSDACDAQPVNVTIVGLDHEASLEADAAKNVLVVQDSGSLEFRFEADSEAEGRELFGFFAQVVLHGVDDALAAQCDWPELDKSSPPEARSAML